MISQGSNKDIIRENQALSITSVLSVAAFVIACVVIARPIFGGSQDFDREVSVSKAQSLAYQIAILESKKSAERVRESLSNRSPSSIEPTEVIGSMGVDLWGQPYHYKVRVEGHQRVVDIWSEGARGIRTQVVIPLDTQ